MCTYESRRLKHILNITYIIYIYKLTKIIIYFQGLHGGVVLKLIICSSQSLDYFFKC